jgi:FkbM family methyltransferase
MLTSPLIIKFRSFTRRLGLNRVIGALFSNGRYEDVFGSAIRAKIRRGDVVWDVGANVGLYSAIFLETTGSSGKVVAFEPTSACFGELRKRFADAPAVIVKNLALGSSDGTISMAIDANPLAATHSVVTDRDAEPAVAVVPVEIRAARSVVHDEPDLFPNVVKIDVEGHEGAVLEGLEPLLQDLRLHCIGIEVHFGLLEERGESWRPRDMERILVRKGFSVHWTDPSHLLATR